MNPSEAWSLLTLRSKRFDRTPGGHGETTTSDVAAMLAGLDGEPYLMGMATDLGDLGSLKQIELRLWQRARGMSERESWDPPNGQFTVRRMAGVALYEAIDDRCCYVCNSTGEMRVSLKDYPGMIMAPSFVAIGRDAGTVRCVACQGSGRVRLSGRKKADLAGIHKDEWTRKWGRRYEPIFAIANGWLETARGYLAQRRRELEGDVSVDKVPSQAGKIVDLVRRKKPKQINNSCAVEKVHDRTRARQVTPDGNADRSEVDFGPLRRPTLKLTR